MRDLHGLSTSARWRLLAFLALLAGAHGCASEGKLTRAVVEVYTDFGPELASISVQITNPQSGKQTEPEAFEAGEEHGPEELLLSFAVAPRADGESDTFIVTIRGLDAKGEFLVEGRARARFTPGEFTTVRVDLNRACEGVRCDDLSTTCRRDQADQTSAEDCVPLDPFASPNDPTATDGQVEEGDDSPAKRMDGGVRQDANARPDSERRDSDGSGGSVPNPDGSDPAACAPGREPSGAGGCVDVDECAGGLDDCDEDPPACVNAENGAGFSCACPTGYRGDGRGVDGCLDINECEEQTDTCDPLAMCDNTEGSYSCGGCPSGYAPGATGSCEDINECTSNNGGCDTSPMATCSNVVGGPNTCSCPTGYAGNGVGANGCQDPCTPNPCGPGLSCTRTTQGTASCVATCATDSLGCQPGDTCVADADCQTGGDSRASCDATGKVCVTVCASMMIVSDANVEAAKFCKEIDGDLFFDPNSGTTIPSTAFPYLTRVRGRVYSTAGGSTLTWSMTLSALNLIDGRLELSAIGNLSAVSLPRLTSIGGDLDIGLLPATRLSLPQLTSVQGGFRLLGLAKLTQIDIGRLRSVGGAMTLSGLCALPWEQVETISTLGTSQVVQGIGCCSTFGGHNCSGTAGCSCE